ncbi:siderophore-interacting protein [Corynebacterium sp. sy039]|uniref:siderophore-interacting protein n=1 Tax=Corynebacterium sp. sy039 TaxID=2599641 RepID=UPI0011B7F2B0|nr:siderophore-interacting protein [Corynebacterium sp. sy039]QDZ42245.1 siderophore-interacting protein [Corynebacterium sp. sy039]
MPRNSRQIDISPISVRELEVLRIEDLTTGMRRIIFGGSQLGEHTYRNFLVPALKSTGFDDDVRLIFPHPTTGERPRPEPDADGRLQWDAQVKDLFRTYTVQHWDPEAQELSIDFAHHSMGLAQEWSQQATPGDKLWVAGPKNSMSLPCHTDWLLLIGDETALPAISRCLAELPDGHPTWVFIEVATEEHILTLESNADVHLQWAIRDQEQNCASILAQALDDDIFPKGVPYIWAAGETSKLRELRTLAKNFDAPKEHQDFTGYWRYSDAQKNDEGIVEGGGYSIMEKLHELSELAPAFALRAALNLDIFTIIGQQKSQEISVSALSNAAGTHLDSAWRFFRYLGSLDLLELSDNDDPTQQTVKLTALSRELADVDSHLTKHLRGPAHLRALSLLNLEDTLRTGMPTQISPWEVAKANNPLTHDDYLQHLAERAHWLAPAIAQLFPPHSLSTVVICGSSAHIFADEFLRATPNIRATLIGAPSEITFMRRQSTQFQEQQCTFLAYSPDEVELFDAHLSQLELNAETTAVILVDPFAMPDAQEMFRQLQRHLHHAWIITDIMTHNDSEEHQYEEDLIRLSTEGTRVPTHADITNLLTTHGWDITHSQPIGWSSHALKVQK